MKDMFEIGRGHYVLGDCMDYLKDIPDNYFNLSICDPPYGIGENKGQYKSRNANRKDNRNGKAIKIKHKGYKPKKWDNKAPSKEYFNELFRVSKNQIIWGVNHFTAAYNFKSGRIFWDKVNGDCDFSDGEIAFCSLHNSTRLIRYMWCGFLQGKSIKEGYVSQGNKKLCEKRQHPTQKPIKLYRWLLQNYAKPNDLILDTHVGSASSLIACEIEGFKYVGFEKDSDYYQQSTKRIKQHLAQKVLF